MKVKSEIRRHGTDNGLGQFPERKHDPVKNILPQKGEKVALIFRPVGAPAEVGFFVTVAESDIMARGQKVKVEPGCELQKLPELDRRIAQ